MIIGPVHKCPGNRPMCYVHQSACSGHQMWLTHVMRKFHASRVIGLSLAAHCAAQGKRSALVVVPGVRGNATTIKSGDAYITRASDGTMRWPSLPWEIHSKAKTRSFCSGLAGIQSDDNVRVTSAKQRYR